MHVVQVGKQKSEWFKWAVFGLLALHLIADVVLGLLILGAL